jgi:hypothetical protein
MKLYDKYTSRIKSAVLISGFNEDKEVRSAKEGYLCGLISLTAGFLLAGWFDLLGTANFWKNVAVFWVLGIIYTTGIFILSGIIKIRCLDFIWGLGFIFMEWILMMYLDTVIPSGNITIVFILAFCFLGIGLNVNKSIKIKTIKRLIKQGLVIPQNKTVPAEVQTPPSRSQY